MNRNKLLGRLYAKRSIVNDFDFDGLMLGYKIYDLINPTEVWNINRLVTAARYSDMPKNEKFGYIDEILAKNHYFTRITTGTNRIVYKCNYDDRVILKVAMDDVGLRDSPSEAFIQNVLKPRVPKVFDVTPCGTIGLFERVDPILSRFEFANYAEEIFNIVVAIGQSGYIMEDIGTDFFKNWGIRDGFGPVLLDFPYVYQTDMTKLMCTKILEDGTHCHGMIDYDDGFNTLVCENCHQRYTARSLAINNGAILYNNHEEAVHKMMESFKVSVIKGEKEYVVNEGDPYFMPKAPKNTNIEIKSTVQFRQHDGRFNKENLILPDSALQSPRVNEILNSNAKPEYVSEKVVVTDAIPPIENPDGDKTNKNETEWEEVTKERILPEEADAKIAEAIDKYAKDSISARDKAYIPHFLSAECSDFPFGDFEKADYAQRDALIDFCLNKLINKFPTVDPNICKAIAIEFVDGNYYFEDDMEKQQPDEDLTKEEKMALEYGVNVDDEENEDRPRRKSAKDEF